MALVGAVALGAVSATKNWDSLLCTVVGLFLLVVAGWYALSRHGAVRVAATLLGVGGVALLVVGLVVADPAPARIIAVCVLAIGSLVAARYALRRTAAALQDDAAARTPVPAAAHPVLIVNPKSGDGKAERTNLVDRAAERGIRTIVLHPGDDLLALADDAIRDGADVVGMAGGDGSQALVASVAMRRGIPHVVVPAGTRNHFALDLGLDRDDVVGALDAFTDGVERRIDLAQVNDRIFVNNASLGVYAKIVQSAEYRGAKRQTAARMLPDLVGPDAAPLDLRFSGPDGRFHHTAQVVLVSNGPYELERMQGRGTRERLDLGQLGVAALQVDSAVDASRLVAAQAVGRLAAAPGWLEWTTPRFRIDSDQPVEIGVDGEALRMDPPLDFESLPGALRVRLPRRALGRSPAARAVHLLEGSTLAELARVAAGRPAGE